MAKDFSAAELQADPSAERSTDMTRHAFDAAVFMAANYVHDSKTLVAQPKSFPDAHYDPTSRKHHGAKRNGLSLLDWTIREPLYWTYYWCCC